jgi:hypothetical protein
MPGTTPRGTPYALPTDPLVQWPGTSQQMAQKIDERPLVRVGTSADNAPAIDFQMISASGTTDAGGMLTVPLLAPIDTARRWSAQVTLHSDHNYMVRLQSLGQYTAGVVVFDKDGPKADTAVLVHVWVGNG